MPNYNADLQAKNAELDAILKTVNALPEAAKPETAGSEIIKANGKKTFSPPAGGVFSSFTADVQVPIPPATPTQEKTVSITENGDVTITPDVGKLLSKVIAQVNVAGGGGGSPKPFKNIIHRTWTPASDTKNCPVPEQDIALAAIVSSSRFLDGHILSAVSCLYYGFGVLDPGVGHYGIYYTYGTDMGAFGGKHIYHAYASSGGFSQEADRIESGSQPFKGGETYHVIIMQGPMDYS